MQGHSVSRRAILKSIGLIGLGAAAAARGLPKLHAQGDIPALPRHWQGEPLGRVTGAYQNARVEPNVDAEIVLQHRMDEHTSELQSPTNLVCRLLLEKK